LAATGPKKRAHANIWRAGVADIVIVNPRFGLSFWGMERCMGLLGKRANLPVSCLALLAALVPKEHDVTVIDENVEEIDFERLERADMICLTGMNVQGNRMREILERVRGMKALKVVGGPLATVEPEEIEDLADVIFIGEADLTWPQFLDEWTEGRHQRRYEQREKTDMTTLPLPRLDLLKNHRYMFGSMQISRGCPFTCEFCDIIVTFGRKPRLKTGTQVIAELEAYVRAGFRILFVVDDNLIGNKRRSSRSCATSKTGKGGAVIRWCFSPKRHSISRTIASLWISWAAPTSRACSSVSRARMRRR
jgi:hypothetical protein